MNYPMDSIVIIAPIMLLVLLIAIPVIGAFAGWKRSAYWGGGSFFFFIMGVIIWKTAGASIAAFAKPLLTKTIQSISTSITITDKILVSVAAPLFFILVMMIAELILLINYYAWFKRVSGIKQDIQVNKAYKLAKKNNTKMKAQPKGWSAMQVTTKGKVINVVCGGAGLTMLLAPSTITFSQALFYTTTSVETRKNNKFANDLYYGLQVWVSPFNWMSYYSSTDTAKDYNSLFSLVSLSNTETEYTYFDANGNEITTTGNVTEAITNIVSGGIQTLVKKTTEGGDDKETKVKNTEDSITTLSTQWNPLVSNNKESVDSVFNSENVTEIMKQVIGEQATTKQTITEDQIIESYLDDDSVFAQVYDNYINERSESEKLIQLTVSQDTFNNVVEAIKDTYIIADGTSQNVIDQFNEKIKDMVSLMFIVA